MGDEPHEQFHIVLAVISNYFALAFSPPANGIKSVAGFPDSEGMESNIVQLDPVAKSAGDVDQQVK